MRNVEKIEKAFNPYHFLIYAAIGLVSLTIAVYGFIEKSKQDTKDNIKEAVAPLYRNDSIMLNLIRSDIMHWQEEQLKSSTIVKYINDPELTKRINEQSELIQGLTEELKKNDYRTASGKGAS
jgi:hypothetical protein